MFLKNPELKKFHYVMQNEVMNKWLKSTNPFRYGFHEYFEHNKNMRDSLEFHPSIEHFDDDMLWDMFNALSPVDKVKMKRGINFHENTIIISDVNNPYIKHGIFSAYRDTVSLNQWYDWYYFTNHLK